MRSLFLGMMRFSSHVYFWKEESRRETWGEECWGNDCDPRHGTDPALFRHFSSLNLAFLYFMSACFHVSAGADSMEIPCFEQELLGCTALSQVPYQESCKGGRALRVVCGSMAEPQPPAWITEHFGNGASSVWVLFLNWASPCLCFSEGFSLLLQHFPLSYPPRAVGRTWKC